MSDKIFLDTNVLVYAYDESEPAKRDLARTLLRAGMADGNAYVSAQVLGECFTVLTKKISQPLSVGDAFALIRSLSRLAVVETGRITVEFAIHLVERCQISFWDAQIIACARLADCGLVMSEDLNSDQAYDELVVKNPFR
jgi:predicted nucleic acid-binding protein